ncbi:MAG: hypothetical protein ACKOEC_01755 [Acidimicrobiia bacterium]
MTLMDNRGRIFARFTIVDIAAIVLMLAVLPLAYGASFLFQPPRPQITEVGQVDITNAERRIVAGGSLLSAKLKIKGSGFNPMLRAYIDDSPALAFVYETPNSADVLVGPLSPGAHDLILMDGVQPVARANGVVKIDDPSRRVLRASGWLTNLDQRTADGLKVGMRFPPGAPAHEIALLGPTQPARSRVQFGEATVEYAVPNHCERAAVVLLRCDPGSDTFTTGQERCTVGGQQVTGWPTGMVGVALPGQDATVAFVVEELFPIEPPTPARVTVRVDDGAAAAVQSRDRDRLLDSRAAVVASKQGNTVTLTVGVDYSREGWRYRGKPIRVGGEFGWATESYEAHGRITSLTVNEARK